MTHKFSHLFRAIMILGLRYSPNTTLIITNHHYRPVFVQCRILTVLDTSNIICLGLALSSLLPKLFQFHLSMYFCVLWSWTFYIYMEDNLLSLFIDISSFILEIWPIHVSIFVVYLWLVNFVSNLIHSFLFIFQLITIIHFSLFFCIGLSFFCIVLASRVRVAQTYVIAENKY